MQQEKEHQPNSKEREKIRNAEKRKLDHAIAALNELAAKHLANAGTVEYELEVLKVKLGHAIKFQHVSDQDYRGHKIKMAVRQGMPEPGDF